MRQLSPSSKTTAPSTGATATNSGAAMQLKSSLRAKSFAEQETQLKPREGAIQRREAAGESAPKAPQAPSGGAGSALPAGLRVQMEQSFGADFGGVRVHQGGEAGALGAHAYAQGENLHFAPGQYNPGSSSGKALIGHELAHVVQQRRGKVAVPQGKAGPYAQVNADRGLEAEADRAGAAAAAGMQASVSGHAHGSAAPQARSAGAPIQGNFGFEVEVGGGDGWRATFDKKGGEVPDRARDPETNKKPKLPPKGFAITSQDGFQLQAEDSGAERTIEFVTDAPGLKSRSDFEKTLASVADLGKQLAQRNGQQAFNAGEIGGAPSIKLSPGGALTGSLQATAGVPLAAIPALFDEIKEAGWEGADNMQFAKKSAEKSLEGIGNDIIGQEDVSGELLGLVTMLKYYIMLGSSKQFRSFPKGIFNVMSRTNFTKMFSMLPQHEREAIVNHMDTWVQAVTGSFNAQEPVVNSVFNYDDSHKSDAMSIATTRQDWLEDMPNEDRLTKDGHQREDLRRITPKEQKKQSPQQMEKREVSVKEATKLKDKIEGLYEGLGAYGDKTDTVRYEDEDEGTEAVILELRNPPTLGTPDGWEAAIDGVYEVVVKAIWGAGGNRGYYNEQSPKQEQLRQSQAGMAETIRAERIAHSLDKMI